MTHTYSVTIAVGEVTIHFIVDTQERISGATWGVAHREILHRFNEAQTKSGGKPLDIDKMSIISINRL